MLGITLNAAVSDAKIYSRCQLAKELFYQGISKTFISNCKRSRKLFSGFSCLVTLGVCLIEAESGADTSKVTEFPNLSTSYGVFQVNSKEWCRKGRRGGECSVRCEGSSIEGQWPADLIEKLFQTCSMKTSKTTSNVQRLFTVDTDSSTGKAGRTDARLVPCPTSPNVRCRATKIRFKNTSLPHLPALISSPKTKAFCPTTLSLDLFLPSKCFSKTNFALPKQSQLLVNSLMTTFDDCKTHLFFFFLRLLKNHKYNRPVYQLTQSLACRTHKTRL